MWTHLEWFCEHAGIARVFDDGKEFETDNYLYAMPFVVRERYQVPDEDGFIGEVEAVGGVKPPTLSQARSMLDAMHKSMYRVMVIRVKHGKKHTIKVCSRHGRQT
jgi:hypothetical protein